MLEIEHENGRTDKELAELRAIARRLIPEGRRFRLVEICDVDIHELIARNTESFTENPFTEETILEIAMLETSTSMLFDGNMLEGYGDHLFFELVRTV